MGGLFSRSRPDNENPTYEHIKARQEAERLQQEAQKAAKAAQNLVGQFKREAQQDRELARKRQEEADQAAARLAEETQRMKGQMEEAERSARRAEELALAASKAAKEDAETFAREAQEERERSQKMREDAERVMGEVREEARKAQLATLLIRSLAEAGRIRAEEAARAAAEETRKAVEEAERRLKEGIQPVATPSAEEVAAAKRRIQYKEDCFHFAIAGISGSGKSSLLNALCGLHNRDAGAAAVGITETTLQMARYPDANPESPYVWYDIPGAGTLKCRDWQYFNNQGLYVFDCIIMLFDNRFTMTDIAILINARRFNIPTYIVRSKADQHIRNVMMDMGYDSDGDGKEDVERRDRLYKAARKQFIEKTRKSVQANLEDANIADQRVYIISNSTMLGIVQERTPKKTIDEAELLNDLVNEAYIRRNRAGE